jgi:hypothetical protein
MAATPSEAHAQSPRVAASCGAPSGTAAVRESVAAVAPAAVADAIGAHMMLRKSMCLTHGPARHARHTMRKGKVSNAMQHRLRMRRKEMYCTPCR